MKIPINESMDLRDAMAIDFFLNNAMQMLDCPHEEHEDIVKNIETLAKSSFHLANIFCKVKTEFDNQEQIETTENIQGEL